MKNYIVLFVALTMTIGAWAQPEVVDLGLPSGVKWASCNLGAARPSDYGDPFAWGETETKEHFREDNYKYSAKEIKNGSAFHLATKYCSKEEWGDEGYKDALTTLEPTDDAARVKLGGKWCIPSVENFEELKSQCKWEWTTEADGVCGYRVTGRNGNSIFIPAAGYRNEGYGHGVRGKNEMGFYWLSSIFELSPLHSYDFLITNTRIELGATCRNNRYCGQPIRAVWKE